MIFRQFTYGAGGCASYLVGCSSDGVAVVIDPPAELGPNTYLDAAAEAGLRIVGAIDTHIHADHVSCAPELAALARAPYYLPEGAQGQVKIPFTPLDYGSSLQIGRVELQVLHTPGHTPESTCLLVTDHARSPEPWFLLTGDTLFVGDVGRPDLLTGEAELDEAEARRRAERLFHSLQVLLRSLPEHVEIYPSHFGGSACGGVNMSGKPGSTLGFEKKFNLALQHSSAGEFAEFVFSTLRPRPAGYQLVKRANMGLKA